MVFIDVIGPKGARTVAFPIAELNIGSASDCDLQLDHPDVSAHHASVIERGGHAVVLDLGEAITRVDGTPAKGATILTEESEVLIGPFRLRFRHVDLPPDTVQTQTVRQPSAPPIPMADADIEILSASPSLANPPSSAPYEPVHSSEVVLSPLTDFTQKPMRVDAPRRVER
jgi:predicted component of type VI protein secretion system